MIHSAQLLGAGLVTCARQGKKISQPAQTGHNNLTLAMHSTLDLSARTWIVRGSSSFLSGESIVRMSHGPHGRLVHKLQKQSRGLRLEVPVGSQFSWELAYVPQLLPYIKVVFRRSNPYSTQSSTFVVCGARCSEADIMYLKGISKVKED